MTPAFKPGDHVLTFNWITSKKGDVIIFRSNGKNFIKRVKRIKGEFIYVVGDNIGKSSGHGPIRRWQIVGKVIFKY